MIKINLLGEEARTSKTHTPIIAGYLGSIGATLAILFFLHSSVSSRMGELDKQRAELETKLAELEVITKDVRELEKTKKDLDMKLSVIATLKLSKQGPVRVLDDLNIAMPDALWLTDAKETKGVLEITGIALDNAQIVEFMKGLEKSDYFKSVDLVESNQSYLVRATDTTKAGGSAAPGRGTARLLSSGNGTQNAANAQARDLVHKLVSYEGLTKDQRDAFAHDAFGVGLKVRSFTLRCGINYAGKLTAAPAAVPAAGEAKKDAAPKAKAEGEA